MNHEGMPTPQQESPGEKTDRERLEGLKQWREDVANMSDEKLVPWLEVTGVRTKEELLTKADSEIAKLSGS